MPAPDLLSCLHRTCCHAWTCACAPVVQASEVAQGLAKDHWHADEFVQGSIVRALQEAQGATGLAQAARSQASTLSAKLDAAIAMLHSGLQQRFIDLSVLPS